MRPLVVLFPWNTYISMEQSLPFLLKSIPRQRQWFFSILFVDLHEVNCQIRGNQLKLNLLITVFIPFFPKYTFMPFSVFNRIEALLQKFEVCPSKFSLSSIVIPSNFTESVVSVTLVSSVYGFVFFYCLCGAAWLKIYQD